MERTKMNKAKIVVIILAHLISLYSLYPYVHGIGKHYGIQIPIYSFQYKTVIASILGGPFLGVLGIIMLRTKNNVNRFLGTLYLIASMYWLYRLIYVLSQE